MKVYVLLITQNGKDGLDTNCMIFATREEAQKRMKELYYIKYDNNYEDSYIEDNYAYVELNSYDIRYEIQEKELN